MNSPVLGIIISLALLLGLFGMFWVHGEILMRHIRHRRQRKHPKTPWDQAYASPHPLLLNTLTRTELQLRLDSLCHTAEGRCGVRDDIISYVFIPDKAERYCMEFLLSEQGGVALVWLDDVYETHHQAFSTGELRRICQSHKLLREIDSTVSEGLYDYATGILIWQDEKLWVYPHCLEDALRHSPFTTLLPEK